MRIKQTARVLSQGSIVNNKLTIDSGTYPVKLTYKVKEAVDNGELDLSDDHLFILVPYTLNPDSNKENEPYLEFLVIGVVRNQENVIEDVVNITGKVIYENINYNYILVKLETTKRNLNDQKLKLYGVLEDSVRSGKGTAVDNLYDIQCTIDGNQLVITDSYRIKEQRVSYAKPVYRDNVVQFPQRKQYYDAA